MLLIWLKVGLASGASGRIWPRATGLTFRHKVCRF